MNEFECIVTLLVDMISGHNLSTERKQGRGCYLGLRTE